MNPIIHAKVECKNGTSTFAFPCKDSEWWEQRASLTEDEAAEFFLISIEPKDFDPLKYQKVRLDELNFLAKRVECLTFSENPRFFGALQAAEKPTVKDAINISLNLNHFTVVQDVMNLKAVGKNHYKNLHGGVLPNEMSEKELTKLGRQLLTSGKCVPTDYGLLFENEEVPMREVYDGTVFPLYNRDDHYVALCSMESHGKKEYLHLPEEEITIKMAMGRLGASSLEDCSVKIENVSIDQEEWPEWLNRVLRDEGLGALNSLADVLIRNRLEWDKVTALIQYAEVNRSWEMKAVIKGLCYFVYLKGPVSDADIGRHFASHEPEYRVPKALMDFIDFARFGQFIRQKHSGKDVKNGFVCMDGRYSLDTLLETTY